MSIKLITGFVTSAGCGYAAKSATGTGFTITSAVPVILLPIHPLLSIKLVTVYVPASLVAITCWYPTFETILLSIPTVLSSERSS